MEMTRLILAFYEFGATLVPDGRGRQAPFKGHRASPVCFPNPQAFIIPRWQIEKSNLIGSIGSMALSDAVMSAAMRQPGLFNLVS
jgi:hypothetical protein